MCTSHHRRRRALAAASVFTAFAALADPASAVPADFEWARPNSEGDVNLPPPAPQSRNPVGFHGPIPSQAFELFSNCPTQSDHPEISSLGFCLVFRIYDAQIKLGKTTADIDPFQIAAAVWLDDEGVPSVLMGGGGGGPSSVPMPGGIFGDPGLDALVAADPLNLLSLSASPELGTVAVVNENPAEFLSWAAGDPGDWDVNLEVPVTIHLGNLLLGDDCAIGEFTLNLRNRSNGSGRLAAHDGETRFTTWYENETPTLFDPGRQFYQRLRLGSRLVDNSFIVDGASDCGPLGIGKVLSDAGLDDLNLINAIVDAVAGLPAGRGQNYATFAVDSAVTYYNELGIGVGSWFLESAGAD